MFSAKRPVCDAGRPELKPSLCLSLGSHEGHFTCFRAPVSQIINEYKHSPSVVIINNPGQEIQDFRREKDWLAPWWTEKKDHLFFRARKSLSLQKNRWGWTGRPTNPDQIHKSMVSINLFKKFVLSSNYASGPKLGAGEREMDHIVTLPAATGKGQQGLSQCEMGGSLEV